VHNFPPHLSCVATLPENTLMSKQARCFGWVAVKRSQHCYFGIYYQAQTNLSVPFVSAQSVKDIQVECTDFNDTRHKYFVASL